MRIGVLGGGVNSAVGRAHMAAMTMDGAADIVLARFSDEEAVNLASIDSFGLKNTLLANSLDDFFSQAAVSVDLIVILTPTPDHVEHVSKALMTKKFVLCEKSLACSVEEARELDELACSAQGQLFVMYNYTGYPMVREIRQYVQAGKLGRILAVEAEMTSDAFLQKSPPATGAPQAWRLVDYKLPTVSLDLGVHVINLVRFVCNEDVLSVSAYEANHGIHKGIVDTVGGFGFMSGGGGLSFAFGKAEWGSQNSLQIKICGTLGAIDWRQELPDLFHLCDNAGQITQIGRGSSSLEIAGQTRYDRFKAGHPTGFIEAMANYYCDVFATVSVGSAAVEAKSYCQNSEQAVRDLQFLEAVHRAAKEARLVSVEKN